LRAYEGLRTKKIPGVGAAVPREEFSQQLNRHPGENRDLTFLSGGKRTEIQLSLE